MNLGVKFLFYFSPDAAEMTMNSGLLWGVSTKSGRK